jgi:hypothetical protein
MKSPLSVLLLLAICLITFVFAIDLPQKSVIISFPPNTPADVMDSAKSAILSAGGMITHEYQIFKYVKIRFLVDVTYKFLEDSRQRFRQKVLI